MKAQSILLALAAATLKLALADVAAEANVAVAENIMAGNNIAGAENMAGAAAPADAAQDRRPWDPELWDSSDDERWGGKDDKKDKKKKKGKKPTDPKKCKPGTYGCDWDPKKGAGTKVCNVFGKWERATTCPKHTKCFFNVKNGSPYCLPDY
ncbi:hypothetical protein QBC44DRAFT_331482 [Cladorrhinum sp. PSN332]|nr:hypothetical protein QBC44DRAFT_331482 [Cladorrhinum sp. PSN332]